MKLGKKFEKLIEKYFEKVYQQVVDYLDTIPELNIVQKIDYRTIEDLEDVRMEFGTSSMMDSSWCTTAQILYDH